MIILYLILIFLKLSKEKRIISILIVCNFFDMVRVNLVIHLVKYFYLLHSLQISPIWGIKNEKLESLKTPPNLSLYSS